MSHVRSWLANPWARARFLWVVAVAYLAWTLLPVIIAGLLSANDTGTGLPYYQWLLISLVLVALVVGYDFTRRFATFYVVSNQRLRVRQGVLSRREQTARFERVQNVSISQTLLDRIFKVGAVQFDTAGTDTSDSNLNFRGISDPQELVRIVAQYSHPAQGHGGTSGL